MIKATNAKEQEILWLFRRLSPEKRRAIVQILQLLEQVAP